VALALGIAKGFGLEKILERQVLDKLPAQEAVLSQILQYARILLENTKGGVIAGIGIVILFWAVLRVFNHIERAFNDIWQIKKSRIWRRKLSNYLAFIVIAPILLIMYSSIPVFITTQLSLIAGKFTIFQKISPLIYFLLKLFPYFLIWGLFTFIYILIPNTRVTAGRYHRRYHLSAGTVGLHNLSDRRHAVQSDLRQPGSPTTAFIMAASGLDHLTYRCRIFLCPPEC
jgi:membrane protein